MKIFVIVVTNKGQVHYDRLFSSLRESTIPVETVVVDNTPGDEDVAYIKSHYPEVHIIKTNENLGFGKGNNVGMRYALENGCDYVFLLNQDAWVEQDAIERCVKFANEHAEYGIVSPMHVYPDMKQINMCFSDGDGNMTLLRDAYFAGIYNKEGAYDMEYINAAAWLLPRKALLEVGGFCPLYRQYYEDNDYANRVVYHKLKIGLVPSARIVHNTSKPESYKLRLFNQATTENLIYYLNINRTVHVGKQKTKLLFQYIKSSLLNRPDKKELKLKYQFLRDNAQEIQEARRMHKIKQPNYLCDNADDKKKLKSDYTPTAIIEGK